MVARFELLKSLNETVCWCRSRVDVTNPKYCLRSDELRPPAEFGRPQEREPHEDVDIMVEERFVIHVLQERTRLLDESNRGSRVHGPPSAEGRLLAHFVGHSNHNNLTADYSGGYFDFWDTPPWDTWVHWVDQEDLLVSWVPPEFVNIVAKAISIEVCGMLTWVDEERPDSLYHKIPAWLVESTKERGTS